MAVTAQIQALVTSLSTLGYPVYDVDPDEYERTDRSDEVAIFITEEGAEFGDSNDGNFVYDTNTDFTLTILVHALSGENAPTLARTAIDAVLPRLSRTMCNRTRPTITAWARIPEDSINKARYTISFTFNTYEDYR